MIILSFALTLTRTLTLSQSHRLLDSPEMRLVCITSVASQPRCTWILGEVESKTTHNNSNRRIRASDEEARGARAELAKFLTAGV